MRSTLGRDLVAAQINRERWTFSDDALDLYGIYELQTLEDVLRRGETGAIRTVATSIRHKAGLPDHGDAYDLLFAYSAALCAPLEPDLLPSSHRADTFPAA